MHETDADLVALQALLDDTYSRAGEHLRSIHTPERRVHARDLVQVLRGVRVLDLATVTAQCEPRVGPVDGIFYRGHFWFGSAHESVRFRHLRARPQVSGAHTIGETFAVIVHGRAVEIDVAAPEHAAFKATLLEVYPEWEAWHGGPTPPPYARIDADAMYAYAFEPTVLEGLLVVPDRLGHILASANVGGRMPAVTPASITDLPVLADADGTARRPQAIVTAQESFEGAGFPVFRPFPQPGADVNVADPFLMLDEMGPVTYGPGEAVGAPDHPHRGFETVTYLFDGEMEHRDSTGGGGVLRGGDTQWMTAGAGLVHSETPTPAMLRDGGLMHGIQLWVNLPRADKLADPQYQDLTGDKLTLVRTADGRGFVRIVAGSFGGYVGPGDTHTPIVYAHATLDAGGHLAVEWPDVFNALVYVLRGTVRIGDDARTVGAHQLAVLTRDGATVSIDADEDADFLLLGGRPLREPIAWYGPFVMNTKQEVLDAVDDFEAGRMGTIAPEHV